MVMPSSLILFIFKIGFIYTITLHKTLNDNVICDINNCDAMRLFQNILLIKVKMDNKL